MIQPLLTLIGVDKCIIFKLSGKYKSRRKNQIKTKSLELVDNPFVISRDKERVGRCDSG